MECLLKPPVHHCNLVQRLGIMEVEPIKGLLKPPVHYCNLVPRKPRGGPQSGDSGCRPYQNLGPTKQGCLYVTTAIPFFASVLSAFLRHSNKMKTSSLTFELQKYIGIETALN